MGKRNGDKPLCYVWGRGLGFAGARGHPAWRRYRAGRLARPELIDASLRGQGLPLALAQRLEVANAGFCPSLTSMRRSAERIRCRVALYGRPEWGRGTGTSPYATFGDGDWNSPELVVIRPVGGTAPVD